MIARTRKRPRVRSSSFRTLGWLITRQACWHVFYGPSSPTCWPFLAEKFTHAQTTPLRYLCERRLQRTPELREL